MLIQVNPVELPFVMENQIVLFLVAQELSVKKIQMAKPLAGCFFQIYEFKFLSSFLKKVNELKKEIHIFFLAVKLDSFQYWPLFKDVLDVLMILNVEMEKFVKNIDALRKCEELLVLVLFLEVVQY